MKDEYLIKPLPELRSNYCKLHDRFEYSDRCTECRTDLIKNVERVDGRLDDAIFEAIKEVFQG